MVDDPVQIINLASFSNLAGKERRHVQVVKREVNVLINFSSGIVDYLKALQVNDENRRGLGDRHLPLMVCRDLALLTVDSLSHGYLFNGFEHLQAVHKFRLFGKALCIRVLKRIMLHMLEKLGVEVLLDELIVPINRQK
jgi:hypothetical protein